MELINCSIVTVILCQLNIISKNSISETIINSDRVYNSFDNTSHKLSVLLQSIVHFLGFSCLISIFSILHPLLRISTGTSGPETADFPHPAEGPGKG